jgi:hypothetical protein
MTSIVFENAFSKSSLRSIVIPRSVVIVGSTPLAWNETLSPFHLNHIPD